MRSKGKQPARCYAGRLRRGGPGPARPRPIANAAEVLKDCGRNILEVVPVELLYNVCRFLPGSDLKSLARVNATFCEIACKTLYPQSTLRAQMTSEDFLKVGSRGGKAYAKEWFERVVDGLPRGARRSYIRAFQVLPIAEKDAFRLLRLLPGLRVLSLDYLLGDSLDGRAAARLTRAFGDTTLRQLTTFTCTGVDDVLALEQVLQHTPALTRLVLKMVNPNSDEPDMPWPMHANPATFKKFYVDLMRVLEQTVAPHLHELEMDVPPPNVDCDRVLFDGLGSNAKWPRLSVFVTHRKTQNPMEIIDERWPVFLLHTFEASRKHGGWKFPFRRPTLDIYQAGMVPPGKLGPMLKWMSQNCKNCDGEVAVLETTTNTFEESVLESLMSAAAEDLDNIVDPERVEERIGELSQPGSPIELNLRLECSYAPSLHPDLEKLVQRLAPNISMLTVAPRDPELFMTPGGRDYQREEATRIFADWLAFLKDFIPLCKNMHTFRVYSHTHGNGGDVPLGALADGLGMLCRVFKLRHLDVDCAAITQPATSVSAMVETPEPQVRKVIEALQWISTPSGDDDNVLANLESLTLRGVFIHRMAEQAWFRRLAADLPSLTSLRIKGLVWHLDYAPEAVEDNWEDADSDDDLDDYDSDASEEQRLRPGDVQHPKDEEDREMNKALAKFFLHGLEETMKKKLGIPDGTDPMTVPQYAAAIESRDAMREELEIRAATGVRTVQGNPFKNDPAKNEAATAGVGGGEELRNEALRQRADGLAAAAPPESAAPSAAAAPAEPDQDEEMTAPADAPAEPDNDDVCSTDSGFGADPRFSRDPLQDLRTARLRSWLTAELAAAAAEQGRRVDVHVADVRLDASGLMPWDYRRVLEQQGRVPFPEEPDHHHHHHHHHHPHFHHHHFHAHHLPHPPNLAPPPPFGMPFGPFTPGMPPMPFGPFTLGPGGSMQVPVQSPNGVISFAAMLAPPPPPGSVPGSGPQPSAAAALPPFGHALFGPAMFPPQDPE